MPRISYIAIGNELLKGRIVNTNLSAAAEFLRTQGYDLGRSLVIQDSREAIVSALETELQHNEVLIFSGGLGPTSDDITKKVLAEFFNSGWVEHQPTLELLTDFFNQRGKTLTDRNRLQALVPDTCEVLLNRTGTAPGMCFRKAGKLIFSLPGVPFEMMYLLRNGVLPLIQAQFPVQFFLNHIFRLWGIPEANLADRLNELEKEMPDNVDLSYLPRMDGIWLEMTVRGEEKNLAELQQSREEWVKKIRAVVADKLYTEGKQSLEGMILQHCVENGYTLAVAESMTGGMVAAKLVNVSGASNYFKGSITAYFTEIKTKILHVPADLIAEAGVVSPQTAEAMAKGVRELFGADFGIATTGIAEKNEEAQAQVWVGFADKNHSESRQDFFFHNRTLNIEKAANAALIFLWQHLIQHQG